MPKAIKGPVAMSPQYPRAATRSPRWVNKTKQKKQRDEIASEVQIGGLYWQIPKIRRAGLRVDTHVAQEATGRQSLVGHVVSTQVSEFKGNTCVPPASELLDMDDLGLE